MPKKSSKKRAEDREPDTASKKKRKRNAEGSSASKDDGGEDSTPYSTKYVNKQRCLVLCSRGAVAAYRHLMGDIRALLPHHKKDVKLDTKRDLTAINEIAEMKSCNTALFFEFRKRKDLYLWASATPFGPSVKFLVQNVHTMEELRLTGNCLKGSRPILSFDAAFDKEPHLRVLKELFISLSLRPKFRFASIKPNLLPQSNLFPSNSIPNNPGSSIKEAKLSVSCISPPKPFFCFSSFSKILEFSKYLPTTDKLEGAFSGLGFSTREFIE